MENVQSTTTPVGLLTIPINLIDTDNRAREDFTGLEQLAESIKRHGLIHPICVRPEDNGRYKLIAGGCRLRAYLLAGMTSIPATLRSNISNVQLKEMEIEENLRRKDFHWTETTRALQQLDELKRSEHGSSTSARFKEEGKLTGWSHAKTAELLGCSVSTVSNDLNLAKDMKDHPDLAKKVIHLPKDMARKKLKTLIKEEVLKQAVQNRQIDTSIDLRHGDCIDLLSTLKDESIDLCITDPPYADETVNAVGKRLSLQYGENENNMGNRAEMQVLYVNLFKELQRVLKPGAHLYIFHAMSWYAELHRLLQDNGFQPDDRPLIWYKGMGTALPKDYHYIPSYEPITFSMKLPRQRSVFKPVPDVFDIPPLRPEVRVHPLQKPDALLRLLLENSSSVGETVLDPFAGSGSLLKEAKKLQRKAIGFEKDEGNFLRAQEWLQKGQ